MRASARRPCAEWAELLAAFHPTDLAPAERAALEAHLATCPACAAARADYRRMDAQIRRLPNPQPFAGLPSRLLELWAEEDRRAGSRQPVLLPRVPEACMQTSTNTGAPSPAPTLLHHERSTRRRLISSITAIAAVLIIALVTMALVVSHVGKSTITGTGSHSPTPTPGNQGWVSVRTLTNLAVQPIIAPSNPQVVYEASIDLTIFRRSDNDGATWTNLPLPTGLTAPVSQALLSINAANAQNVFLVLTFAQSSPACSTSQASTGQINAYSGNSCQVSYSSTDGGLNWGLMRFPGGISIVGADALSQGDRLFLVVYDTNQQRRLVSSTDGGANWQFADGSLRAQGEGVCSIAGVPAGASLFAFADPGTCSEPVGYQSSARSLAGPTQAQSSVTLWKSDDAAAHWNKVSAFPYPAPDVNVFQAVSAGNAAEPILYAAAGQASSYVRLVSIDGGKTWQPLLDQGLPTNLTNDDFPAGSLSDGSVLRAVQTGQVSWAYYAWKPGSQAWQQLTPPFTGDPVETVVVPSASGHDTLWVVTTNGKGNYSVLRYTLK